MVFNRLMGTTGAGGPSVETALADPSCRPGGRLAGVVRVRGGEHPVDVSHLALALVTRVEVESVDAGYDTGQEFGRRRVSGPFRLEPGQRYDIPFHFEVPWETPLTDLDDRCPAGVSVGLRTELAVARAVDSGDLDPVAVRPLPAQERVLRALSRLGFRFARAGVERGHLYGVRQSQPFYQELEFDPPPRYAGTMNHLELIFIADPRQLHVILEPDRPAGLLTRSGDPFAHLAVDHPTAEGPAWPTHLDAWLHKSLSHPR